MRIVSSASISRPTYYDRNPVARQLNYSAGGVVPHGATQRATYTVPAGKRAFCDAFFTSVRRSGAAAPVGVAQVYAQYTPNGGTAGLMGMASLSTNNVNDTTSGSGTGMGIMYAGDVLGIFSSDTSTGGTVDYNIHYKITEFDA